MCATHCCHLFCVACQNNKLCICGDNKKFGDPYVSDVVHFNDSERGQRIEVLFEYAVNVHELCGYGFALRAVV